MGTVQFDRWSTVQFDTLYNYTLYNYTDIKILIRAKALRNRYSLTLISISEKEFANAHSFPTIHVYIYIILRRKVLKRTIEQYSPRFNLTGGENKGSDKMKEILNKTDTIFLLTSGLIMIEDKKVIWLNPNYRGVFSDVKRKAIEGKLVISNDNKIYEI